MPTDAPRPSLPELADQLLRNAAAGVLSTLSQHIAGFPFGSITPYALARNGDPLLVISDLAEHTKNVRVDPRASLFVQDGAAAADPQAGARMTLLGRLVPSTPEAFADERARYVARHPEAEQYLALDFHVYRLHCEHVRLVGGFGRVAWLEASSIRSGPDPLADACADICAHMNDDHAELLPIYCRALRGVSLERPRMIGIDAWGFDLRDEASGTQVRFDFTTRVASPEAARRVLVAMAGEAREKLARAGDQRRE